MYYNLFISGCIYILLYLHLIVFIFSCISLSIYTCIYIWLYLYLVVFTFSFISLYICCIYIWLHLLFQRLPTWPQMTTSISSLPMAYKCTCLPPLLFCLPFMLLYKRLFHTALHFSVDQTGRHASISWWRRKQHILLL